MVSTVTDLIEPENAARNAKAEQQRTQTDAFFMAVIISCLCGISLAICHYQKFDTASEVLLDGRINPNTASVASLVRLPGIGPSRAAAIIEYRKGFTDSEMAYKNCKDLQKIKGIGPKTAEKIRPWVCFE